MKNLEELQKLINQSRNIETAISTYRDKYLKDEKHYDKLGFGFNLDSRFAACQGLTLYVSSWKGTYGNSGCSSILDVDKDLFNKHLLKVLEKDFWSIMERVSESLYKEATTLKEQAKKELEEKLEKVNSL